MNSPHALPNELLSNLAALQAQAQLLGKGGASMQAILSQLKVPLSDKSISSALAKKDEGERGSAAPGDVNMKIYSNLTKGSTVTKGVDEESNGHSSRGSRLEWGRNSSDEHLSVDHAQGSSKKRNLKLSSKKSEPSDPTATQHDSPVSSSSKRQKVASLEDGAAVQAISALIAKGELDSAQAELVAHQIKSVTELDNSAPIVPKPSNMEVAPGLEKKLVGKKRGRKPAAEKMKAKEESASSEFSSSQSHSSNEKFVAGDDKDLKAKRLVQNRKSAQKCRLKKKAEFQQLRDDVSLLRQENKDLKDKLNDVTMKLYSKIDENSKLSKKVEAMSRQQTMFTTKMMLNQQQPNPSVERQVAALLGLDSAGDANQQNLIIQLLKNQRGSASGEQSKNSSSRKSSGQSTPSAEKVLGEKAPSAAAREEPSKELVDLLGVISQAGGMQSVIGGNNPLGMLLQQQLLSAQNDPSVALLLAAQLGQTHQSNAMDLIGKPQWAIAESLMKGASNAGGPLFNRQSSQSDNINKLLLQNSLSSKQQGSAMDKLKAQLLSKAGDAHESKPGFNAFAHRSAAEQEKVHQIKDLLKENLQKPGEGSRKDSPKAPKPSDGAKYAKLMELLGGMQMKKKSQ